MATIGVSHVPPHRPDCPASLNGPSCSPAGAVSPPPAEGFLLSEEGFQTMMAVFECADLEDELNANAALLEPASGADNRNQVERRRKRKQRTSEDYAAKDVETQASSPPPRLAPAPSPKQQNQEQRGKKRRKQRTDAKMVAALILNRQFRAPEPSRGRTALWCQCAEFPLGAPPCALHQAVGDRSWMTARGGRIPAVGDAGCVVVPEQSASGRGKYRRWRGSVWMPSRFYVERAQLQMALQDEDDFSVVAD